MSGSPSNPGCTVHGLTQGEVRYLQVWCFFFVSRSTVILSILSHYQKLVDHRPTTQSSPCRQEWHLLERREGWKLFLVTFDFFLLATFSFKFNIFNSLNLFSCQPGFLFKLFNSLNPFDLSLFWISCPPVWIRNKKAALTFLSCMFSNVLLKRLYENVQSHIGCTYLSPGLNLMSSSLN